MTDIDIIHSGGATETLTHVRSRVTRWQNKRWKATATTTRTEANNASLTEDQDYVEIVESSTAQFGGVLENIVYSDDQVDLSVVSYEQLSRDAPPTGPTLAYQQETDSTIVSDAIGAIPDLSAGTVETIQTELDITYHHASRALQLRRLRNITGGELAYNADRTVDYVAELGADKTGTTISPANQNLTRSPVKENRGGEDKKTHLRMIGGSGVSVDVVADSFSSGDREKWGRAAFKGISSESTLRTLGKTLLGELSNDWLEVRATLTALSPSLGDTYTVDYPELGIDQEELRVARLDVTRDNSGTHHDATLSNRSLTRYRAQETTAQRVSESARMGQTTSAQHRPNVTLPVTELPANTYVDQYVVMPKGTVLYLWLASKAVIEADESDAGSVFVRLIDEPELDETEVYAESTSDYATKDALALIDATNVRRKVAFRLDNTSSNTVRASAAFSFTLQREPGSSELAGFNSGATLEELVNGIKQLQN